MNPLHRRYIFALYIGDIAALYASLWLALMIRYRSIPSYSLIGQHLAPFSIIFLIWLIVFYIAGLYERRTLILKYKLVQLIFKTHLFNSALAVVFFYFIPFLGITPKTNLFIFLVISLLFLIIWRIYGARLFSTHRRTNSLLIASGPEMKELYDEVRLNTQYSLNFSAWIDLASTSIVDYTREVKDEIHSKDISVIIVDFESDVIQPLLPTLYDLVFSQITFIDMYKLYEDVFNRIPLSLIRYSWFLENISLTPKALYDFLKRAMDIGIAVVGGLISLILYPFIFVFIKIDDGGHIFIRQTRVGQHGKPFTMYKFRTMTTNDDGHYSSEVENKVTRVGEYLRRSRLDELPQLWNVLKGEQSLIGPRPELPSLVALYEKEISYYNVRHLIKPGLSGWAQIYHDNHPHHHEAVEATKEKLSYDLYYLKNRSFALDIKIALKTIKKLLMRSGV